MFWIYVLRDEIKGQLYIGSTEDLDRRLIEHRSRKPTYQLIHKESFDTKIEAYRREMYLKTGNGRRALTKLLNLSNTAFKK